MRFGIKAGSIVAIAASVLMAAACSSSGQVNSSGGKSTAGSSGGPGSSTSASGSKSPGAPSSSSSTSDAPSAASSSSASSSSGGSGTALTADQISKLLLTDKDDPGYTFDAAQDDTTTTAKQHVVTVGGADCQKFVDAQDALTTKYGTTAEVDRQLTKAAENHAIQDSVMVLPSADKAKAAVADLTAGLQNCKNLTMTDSDSQVTMAPAPIPQLISDGQAGYIDYVTVSGKTVLMAVEVVHVGTTMSVVALVGPVTSDTNSLHQMGATLSHLSDIQVQRLKTAQGI